MSTLAEAWRSFRRWRKGRPFWGGLFCLVAGFEIFAIPYAPMPVMIHAGAGAMAGIIIGGVLMLCGVMLWVSPAQRSFLGIVALVLALAAFPFSNLGGFLLGTLFGIVGGALGFAWTPIQRDPVPSGDAPETAEPTDEDDPGVEQPPASLDDILDRPGAHAVADDANDPAETQEIPAGGPDGRPTAALAIAAVPLAALLLLVGPVVRASAAPNRTGGGAVACPSGATPGSAISPGSAPTRRRAAINAPDPVAPHVITPRPQPAPQPTGAVTPAPASPTPVPATSAPASPAPATTTPSPSASPSTGLLGGLVGALGSLTTSAAPAPTAPPSPTVPPVPAATASVPASAPVARPSAHRSAPQIGRARLMCSRLLAADTTQPLVAVAASDMTAATQAMTGMTYDGVVDLPTTQGSVRTLQFSMTTSVSTPFDLRSPDQGKTLDQASSRLEVSGNVKFYCTRFAANLLGVPVVFTPDSPPPLVLSDMTFTDAQIKLVYVRADVLTAASLVIRYL